MDGVEFLFSLDRPSCCRMFISHVCCFFNDRLLKLARFHFSRISI